MKRFLSWPMTWPAAIILSAGIADLLVRMNVGSPAQMVAVLWFLLICPGMMAVRFLRLEEPLVEWMLAVALSLAIDTFVAGSLLIAGRWSTPSAFSIILMLTVVGAVIEEARLSPRWRAWTTELRAFVSALFARKPKDESVHEVGL